MKYKNFKVEIGGMKWDIVFLEPDQIKGFNGLCYHSELRIELRNDLPYPIMKRRYIHECVHAIMGCQGRCFQKKYDTEDVCEIVAYAFDDLLYLYKAFDYAQRKK